MITTAPVITGNRLEVTNSSQLDSWQLGLLKSLEWFTAPYLEEKLLEEGKIKSKNEYQIAFNEFKKYVFLTQVYDHKLGMCSKIVDDVWHQFILFTRQYHEFCEDLLGRYLHHSPHTLKTPLTDKKKGVRNFIKGYQEIFGEIPSIWTVSKSNDCSTDMCGADQCNACGNQCSKCD